MPTRCISQETVSVLSVSFLLALLQRPYPDIPGAHGLDVRRPSTVICELRDSHCRSEVREEVTIEMTPGWRRSPPVGPPWMLSQVVTLVHTPRVWLQDSFLCQISPYCCFSLEGFLRQWLVYLHLLSRLGPEHKTMKGS